MLRLPVIEELDLPGGGEDFIHRPLVSREGAGNPGGLSTPAFNLGYR